MFGREGLEALFALLRIPLLARVEWFPIATSACLCHKSPMNWIEGPLSALVWICGIAWILQRYLFGVKFHVNNTTFWLERQEKVKGKSRPTYLSDQEEILREQIRASRESAIARR